MTRAIVDGVPGWALSLVVVGAVVGVVLVGVRVVRRRVPITRDGFDAEVSSQMLGVVASLFGLLLAFVIVIEFQAFNGASEKVQEEADGLAAIVRDSEAFPEPAGTRVREAVGAYARAVREDEWPRMREGEESDLAWQGIDRLFAAMQATTPVTVTQTAFYEDSVRQLNDVLAARRDRLAANEGDLPAPIAALVLVGALVILGYATLVGSRSSAFHAIGAGAIAVIVSFSLVVLLFLQFPFSGDLAVGSEPFAEGVLAPLGSRGP